MKYTPEILTSLQPNEIFVFGTNQYGKHYGGAAKIASEKFGAIIGVPSGLCGNTYGIITTSFSEESISIDFIKSQVDVLCSFATLRSDLVFYVTKIGTGIAGFSIDQIKECFNRNIPSNIILPKEFSKI